MVIINLVIITIVAVIVLVLALLIWLSISDYKETMRYQRKINDIKVEMSKIERRANLFGDYIS